MIQALFNGLIGGAGLFVGAVLGLLVKPRGHLIGLVMAFGAGVLISALTFDLMGEAYSQGGFDAVSVGFLAGGVCFLLGDWWIDRRGGHHRKAGHARVSNETADASSRALLLGAILDGIPESVAIGIAVMGGKGLGLLLIAAVFLSNVPEALSSVPGFRLAGMTPFHILATWGGVMLLCGGSSMAGFTVFGTAGPNVIAAVESFAAGAILAMLADTMMPEAYERGGKITAAATILGFLLAFVISRLAGE